MQLSAQKIVLKSVNNEAGVPEITWILHGFNEPPEVSVFRSSVKEMKFSEINTPVILYKPEDSRDTTELTVLDTTITGRGLYYYYIATGSGDSVVSSEKVLAGNYGYLPTPVVTEFRATPATDKKAIDLTWKLNYQSTVTYLELFRSSHFDTGYIQVSQLPARATSYRDIVPLANEPWFYFLVVHDCFGGTHPGVRIPGFATFAEKPFRPQNFIADYRNDSVRLEWENTGHNIIGFKVYRSLNDQDFYPLNDILPSGAEKSSFIDISGELRKATKARYFVRNVSDGFVESNSSDTVILFMPDHEPVFPVEYIDYTIDENGNVRLIWPVPEEGLVTGFNVYLTGMQGDTVKLNRDKLRTNFFTDTILRPEGDYLYLVESVGYGTRTARFKRGVAVHRTLPDIDVILSLTRQNDGIEVSFVKSLNQHVTGYKLYRGSGNKSPELLKSFDSDGPTRFTDKHASRGNTYIYILKAILDNNLEVTANSGTDITW